MYHMYPYVPCRHFWMRFCVTLPVNLRSWYLDCVGLFQRCILGHGVMTEQAVSRPKSTTWHEKVRLPIQHTLCTRYAHCSVCLSSDAGSGFLFVPLCIVFSWRTSLGSSSCPSVSHEAWQGAVVETILLDLTIFTLKQLFRLFPIFLDDFSI